MERHAPTIRVSYHHRERCGGQRAHCCDLLNALSHRSGVGAVDGLKLTFHLAGINNQNFLMRDGRQAFGGRSAAPRRSLKGRNLVLVSSDELTFRLWKSEQPNGTLVKDVAEFTPGYAKKDWDVRMQRRLPFSATHNPG